MFLTVSCSDNKDTGMNTKTDKVQKQVQEKMKDAKQTTSELIRKGEIDVASIDKNGDGKVFECPMDWNVISDEAGDCPVCGMHLKEFSLSDVKANLEKYGYKVKQ